MMAMKKPQNIVVFNHFLQYALLLVARACWLRDEIKTRTVKTITPIMP